MFLIERLDIYYDIRKRSYFSVKIFSDNIKKIVKKFFRLNKLFI